MIRLCSIHKDGTSKKEKAKSLHALGPCWFLLSILLASALMVPAVGVDSLLCYFCPLQHKSKSCPNITSQCLPDQRCSVSWGFYGSVHVVSAQGCVNKQLCGSKEMVSYRGVKYDVRHNCCCRDTCNTTPKLNTTTLKKLLKAVTADYSKVTLGVFQEQPFHSCED